MFEPIAIVGRGCVLPDALTPQAFWRNVSTGRVSLTPVPEDRWRLPHWWAIGTPEDSVDRTWSDIGGYVRGVELPAFGELDPLFQWVMHSARSALREASADGRTGLVLGNLSFPSAGLARFAEQVWLKREVTVDPRDRFSSGLPALLVAEKLGLDGAFALDAACASSLYAIKLACDRLHDRSAEVMLAGGVSCADDLFIHSGFCALSALSPSGRSRPFHRLADGLVPAEGAALLALMRLDDAVAQGKKILGVIRGIGLSNDGRSGGLLAPAVEGQERAMRAAYASAGIDPTSVSLVECHATGTPVGDAVEMHSMARVFAACGDLPIGSVKSNVGHLITAAGAAGVLKVLGAMESGMRPATLSADDPLRAVDGTPMRVLQEAEEWPGFRRAAVSAFGFGGNNAHLIVDEWTGDASAVVAPPPPSREPVAIVAITARVGDGRGTHEFAHAVLEGGPVNPRRSHVEVALEGLRFPPKDLEHALPQQLLVMQAAREAVHGLSLPRDRTMILVGMGVDAEAARYGARWRIASWLQNGSSCSDVADDPEELARFRDAFVSPLTAAGVVGTMPNVVANRLNAQLDLAGPSFTVSAEQASGIEALRLAARAVSTGEADAAVVGAVDLSCEPVHEEALRLLGVEGRSGDAAVVLVLKRLRDAENVLAVIDDVTSPSLSLRSSDVTDRFGNAHAATSLLGVATAALLLSRRAVLGSGAAAPSLAPQTATFDSIGLRAGTPVPWLASPAPRPFVYSGTDVASVLASLDAGVSSNTGPARLVILAASEPERLARARAARQWLTDGGIRPEGVAFRATPIAGSLAFVYTNGSACYPDMGRELMLAFPSLLDEISARCGSLPDLVGWAYRGDEPSSVLDQIWGASVLGQLHTSITRGLLGLAPSAVLAYSSGESTALVAMDVWRDVRSLVADACASPLFHTDLAGPLHAVRRSWERSGITGTSWQTYLVNAPASAVRLAPGVHLMAINSPDSCVVGGESVACQRVLSDFDVIPLSYDIAVHAPEVAEVRDAWWQLHHRPTHAPPSVRFYSGATGRAYEPTPDACADAITAQALSTIDFTRVVENAWHDGVRVFVEHGPRGLCTSWIRRILGTRDHVAVALDATDGIRQLTRSVADLMAAGVPVDADRFFGHLSDIGPRRVDDGPHMLFPAHLPPVVLPSARPRKPGAEDAPPGAQSGSQSGTPSGTQEMPRAPWLPPVPPPVGLGGPPAGAANGAPRGVYDTVAGGGVDEIAAAGAADRHDPRNATNGTTADGTIGTSAVAGVGTPAAIGSAGIAEIHAADQSAGAPDLAAPDALAPAGTTPAWPIEPAQPGGSLPTDLILNHQRAMTAAHTTYLATQAAMHDQFLRTRALATDLLHQAAKTQALKAQPANAPAPAPADTPAKATATAQTPPPVPPAAAPPALPSSRNAKRAPEVPPPSSERPVHDTNRKPGPRFTREQLEHLATGRISDLFGPRFAAQDAYPRQTRMPAPPLLLADRVTGIDAEPASMGTGTIWTETDVRHDWYLDPANRMQAGLVIEAGQADLLLISWLGADLRNKGERVYRLLGCEVTYHGELPQPGDTLQYEITIDGHAGNLFFFHYDCTRNGQRLLSVRNGQAGFFTDDELNDTAGVLWAPPRTSSEPIAEQHPPKWHTRTPSTKQETRTTALTSNYIRTEQAIHEDDWFFDGHFKNDPCMPGTLMFEGCLQAMAQYMIATGRTRDKDGWRFEPAHGQTIPMRCRGQVTPASRNLVYEVFVKEAEETSLKADVLCTVDGTKAFVAENVVLTLVPDWPHPTRTTPFVFDEESLRACATGKPSDAFGPSYERFDQGRKVARLPGEPYHFISRISRIDGEQNAMRVGTNITAEYDVPEEGAWYHDGVMPLAVLMEIALQPCGWLASYVGSALTTDQDLLFRNLDGTGTVHRHITPDTARITTRCTVTQISRSAGMIIEAFDVVCEADGEPLFDLTTVFGYFPMEAFDDQTGLPGPAPRQPNRTEPARNTMFDRITGRWPDGIQAEKDVDPDEWFFKAHFFQDPVQPGSLGVEAMVQAMSQHLDLPPLIRTGHEFSWKYRGQVTPDNKVIRIEVKGDEAWLWADDKRIYHVTNLALEHVIDADKDTWLKDHCPTWTVPALPMMSTVDIIGETVLKDVTLHRWVPLDRPVKITQKRANDMITLYVDGQKTATATRAEPRPAPQPFEPIDTTEVPDPYANLFHGPKFQYLTKLRTSANGASATLRAERGGVPHGRLNQGVLDAATHLLPHDSYSDRVGFPHRIEHIEIFEPLPDTGELQVEARWQHNEQHNEQVFDVQIQRDGRVLAQFRLVDVLLPKGRLGSAPPEQRRRFLHERRYADGLGLSITENGRTTLTRADVERCDWLPGTVARLYGLPPGANAIDHLDEIAGRDHLARVARVHPSEITYEPERLMFVREPGRVTTYAKT